jgi:hypothetical protein
MAFDSPENRRRYEVALTKHDELITAKSREGLSYQNGYNGLQWDAIMDDFEHWCAGRQNRTKDRQNVEAS